MNEILFCQLSAHFHMLQHHMCLLIRAAPPEEQSMFAPAITHIYLYIYDKQA